ncbi:MAG: DUF4177 domain-containing protein [Verrucomicrobiales bacterium]
MTECWEYKSVTFNTAGWVKRGIFDQAEIDQHLNDLGKEGWEAISTTPVSDGSVGTSALLVLMKRRK